MGQNECAACESAEICSVASQYDIYLHINLVFYVCTYTHIPTHIKHKLGEYVVMAIRCCNYVCKLYLGEHMVLFILRVVKQCFFFAAAAACHLIRPSVMAFLGISIKLFVNLVI